MQAWPYSSPNSVVRRARGPGAPADPAPKGRTQNTVSQGCWKPVTAPKRAASSCRLLSSPITQQCAPEQGALG